MALLVARGNLGLSVGPAFTTDEWPGSRVPSHFMASYWAAQIASLSSLSLSCLQEISF